ncbi:hypothetical protein, partial [Thalassobius sp. I31.1]|uniref:hypothetical protein n=1 Tax=Thalassobius sp. I31.1 TaxID=2109912 RepID=UPI001300B3EB
MFESVLLIGGGAVVVLVLLNFLNRSAKQRHAVDPDSLTAELQHLAHQKDHVKDNPTSDTEVLTADVLGTQETRVPDRRAQTALAEAEAKARAALQTKTPPRPVPDTPDEIYLMDANMADIESGDAFKGG